MEPKILNGTTSLTTFLIIVAVLVATCVGNHLAVALLESRLIKGAVKKSTVLCTVTGSVRTGIPGIRRARLTYVHDGRPATGLSGPILAEHLSRDGSELLGTLYATKRDGKPATYWVDIPHG